MRIRETKQLFRDACEYPADAATVSDSIGHVEVEAPTGDTVTIASVLARANLPSYHSADAVYTAMVGNLDESFIGRKYYDDRGDMQPDPNREEAEFSA